MIKKTISYTDIDGIAREEDFYFNFTKAELLELQVSRAGGFAESMEHMRESKDNQEILAVIKEIILKAYGERSNESRHFVKKPEHADAFSHTEAFSNLFMELFSDAAKAAVFFESLMPADVLAEAKAEQNNRPAPRDHMKKQETTHNVVIEDGVVLETPQKTVDNTGVEMPMLDFLRLTPEAQNEFVSSGGFVR